MTDLAAGTQDAVELLRWCLAAESGHPTPPAPRFDQVRWDRALEVAARHHTVAVIADRADELRLDADARAALHSRRMAAVTSSLPVRSAAVHLMAGLADGGVRCLTYKGPALAALTTGDPSARGAGDVDLLVHPDDVSLATRILVDLGARFVPGYTPDPSSPLWPVAQRLNCEMPYRWRGTDIDLHWRVDRLPQVVSIPFDDLWARRQEVDLGGGVVPTLGVMDALLVTAAHGTKEHWRHWRWIVDVVRQSRGVDDWAAVRMQARAAGCEPALAVALAMHEKLAPLPAGVDRRPGERPRRLADVAWQNACGGAAPFGSVAFGKQVERLRWTVQTAPSTGALGSMIVRQAWTTLDMAEVPLPVSMVWAYPAVRPFLWARRLRTGQFGPSRLAPRPDRSVTAP